MERMPDRVFREWADYYVKEPFGEERADIRMAILATATVNVHMGKKGKRAKLADFLPEFGPPEPVTPDDLLSKVMALNAAVGGEFIDARSDNAGEPGDPVHR